MPSDSVNFRKRHVDRITYSLAAHGRILALLNRSIGSADFTLTLALSLMERGQEFWLPSPLGRGVGEGFAPLREEGIDR